MRITCEENPASVEDFESKTDYDSQNEVKFTYADEAGINCVDAGAPTGRN